MVSESDWAREVLRLAAAVDRQGCLPASLLPHYDSVVEMWTSGTVDREVLMDAKRAFWAFLKDKHGNTTSIADAEDRAVRAALTLVDAPTTDAHLSDAQDWVRDMLNDDAV